MHGHTCTYPCMHAQIPAYAHIHMFMHICMGDAYTRAYAAHMHVWCICTYACINAHIHAYVQICMFDAYAHMHACAYACVMHICTYHIHLYMHMPSWMHMMAQITYVPSWKCHWKLQCKLTIWNYNKIPLNVI